ncbi:MAG: YibE/F family protein [Candidatus Pacebacteria bacterium]|nr:YibE/F family protein [Candidatus Paceibacterota bacterium]MBP9867037.1 YibE/F family protein [Candidatus Paceibacterota bacterium]
MNYKTILFLLFCTIFLVPHTSYAEATLVIDKEVFQKAKVLEIKNQATSTIPGTDILSHTQVIKMKVLDGENLGKEVTFQNDYTQLHEGDIFYVRHQTNHLDNSEYWSVSDPYRLDSLLLLTFIFIALIFIFGGMQGVRGLASLIGSFVLIFYLLIPGIYGGYNAILISIGVASLIIIVGSYITHGFNRTTSSAVLGMIITVIITGIGAYYIVHKTHLSGYSSEESTFLTLNTRGAIDMIGLLFSGIMIGLLGVLYDIAIGQAIAIEELFRAGKHLTRLQVYKRGIRIGREHIGALVNTLAIAYVGASLPLLLLIQNSTTDILFILNSEVFSTEIIRILVGSIGLVLAVPITTLIASYMLHGRNLENTESHHDHTH